MATQLGIELADGVCRFVEIGRRRTRRAASGDTVVRAFASLSLADAGTTDRLASYRGRQAVVVAWGLRSEHVQVVVSPATRLHMCAEASRTLREAGVGRDPVVADVARVAGIAVARQTVLLAAAPGDEIAAVLGPLVAAGIRPRSLVTPALALASLARARKTIFAPPAQEAYVAIDRRATCLALVRDGTLFSAREIPWGFEDQSLPTDASRRRDAIASRLSVEILGFLAATTVGPVLHVCVCGGLPDLRTMALSLVEQLDVEVEPLDSLFGIDDGRLPGEDQQFRDRCAELRLAWVAAADWRPAVDLLRGQRARSAGRAFTRAAGIAGLAAGLGVVALAMEGNAEAPPPRSSLAQLILSAAAEPLADQIPEAAKAGDRAQPPPSPEATTPAPTEPPSLPAVETPPQGASPPRPASAPAPPPTPLPVAPRPAVLPLTAISTEPAAARPAPVVQPPAVAARVPPPAAPAKAEPAPAADRPVADARRRSRPAAPSPATPFDAVLETILHSPERQLAMIDGRIVQAGDVVRGATIVEITTTGVLLRDGAGRLRTLVLGGAR